MEIQAAESKQRFAGSIRFGITSETCGPNIRSFVVVSTPFSAGEQGNQSLNQEQHIPVQ